MVSTAASRCRRGVVAIQSYVEEKLVAIHTQVLHNGIVVPVGVPVEPPVVFLVDKKLESARVVPVVGGYSQSSPVCGHLDEVVVLTDTLPLLQDKPLTGSKLAPGVAGGRPGDAVDLSAASAAAGEVAAGRLAQGREAAGPGGILPLHQHQRVFARVLQVGEILPVRVLPSNVVVDGLRPLDPLQDALILLCDSHELRLPLVPVQAHRPTLPTVASNRGVLHDVRHFLQQDPILAVDLVIPVLQQLLPLQVVPQVVKVHDLR
mmetsp:Transcript_99099/g.212314  ORF Transcript_99099/g.212314 Transcript_99099/m.212314 type:complete len:262 (-) Transcript_99099:205-990(-)